MENNDDAMNSGVPSDDSAEGTMPDGIHDAVAGGTPTEPGAALGSAIGSQFDPPPPPPAPAAPTPPAPPAPTPPTPTPPAPTPPTPTPPVVTPPTAGPTWGTTTPSAVPPTPGAPAAPSSWSSTTPSAAQTDPTIAAAGSGMGYNTPAQAAEYPMAGAVAGNEAKGSSKLPWVFAVLFAVLLLGGGGFFAVSAFGASGGAETPDEAIDTMLAALGEEDFVSIAELMEPSERRTIAEPALTELLPELKRLGVLDDSADAGDVEGVDLVFTDVEYRVEELVGVDDIAHVYLTGGELSTTINSADLPFSSDVDTSDLNQQDSQSIEETDTPIVFVERDGRWYFSMWFTIAEAARLEADERLPLANEQPAQIPSDSPGEAVEGLFTAMTDFDMAAMIGHMDPDEMAVLYRYSPLFLDEAQSELDDLEAELINEGITWEMTDFDFDVDESGDDAVATMRAFTVDVSGPDFDLEIAYTRDLLTGALSVDGVEGSMSATTTQFDIEGSFDDDTFEASLLVEPENLRISGNASAEGDNFEGSLVLDESGGCSRYEVTGTDGTNESGCLEDEGDLEGIGPILEAMEDWPTEFPGVSLRTRQTDGGWYVSPIGTMFDGVITTLEGLEEGDFEDVFNPVADVASDTITDPLDLFDDATSVVTDDDDVLGGFSDPVAEETVFISTADGQIEDFPGAINSGGFDTFILPLDAGSTVIVRAQAEGSGLDTTVRIVGPFGDQIGYNDDAEIDVDLSSGLDSQLLFSTDEAGEYSIEVAGFGTSDGSYVLTVDRLNEVIDGEGGGGGDVGSDDDAGFIEDITTVNVGANETSQFVGSLDDQVAIDSYEMDLGSGETVTVTVESDPNGTLDPVVTVFDPDIIELARNDDAPSSAGVASRDSQVTFTTGTPGRHFIDVSSFVGNSAGAYTITIERGPAGATDAPEVVPTGEAIVVAPGETGTVAGVVSEDQYYSIDLNAGDEVTITVESDLPDDPAELDPVVTLFFGELEIDRNDDAVDSAAVNDSFDSQLIVAAENTGTHTIEVSGFAGSTGGFTMTIQRN